jgi:hypothetical protein
MAQGSHHFPLASSLSQDEKAVKLASRVPELVPYHQYKTQFSV